MILQCRATIPDCLDQKMFHVGQLVVELEAFHFGHMEANYLGVNMSRTSARTSSISEKFEKHLISLSRRHIALDFTLALSADSRLAIPETVPPIEVSVRHKEPCFSIRPFIICVYAEIPSSMSVSTGCQS